MVSAVVAEIAGDTSEDNAEMSKVFKLKLVARFAISVKFILDASVAAVTSSAEKLP